MPDDIRQRAPAAVVCATKHDWATQFVYEAAVEVERLLGNRYRFIAVMNGMRLTCRGDRNARLD
jgi:hypothetical protein